MLVTTISLLVVSVATRKLYDAGYFPDFLSVFTEDSQPVVVAMTGRDVGGLDNPGVDVNSEKTVHVEGNYVKKNENGAAYPQLDAEKF